MIHWTKSNSTCSSRKVSNHYVDRQSCDSVTSNTGFRCPYPSISCGSSDFGIEEAVAAEKKINQWLKQCTEAHSDCQISANIALPTCVLKGYGPKRVRLYVPGQEEKKQRYACFSHCWGGIIPLQTTSHTLRSFQDDDVPWNALPKTFRDAIDLIYRLGIKYIWIDSLCILQDN